MTPEQWQRAYQLFCEAAAQSDEARREFLSRQCADDPELLREVESLLAGDGAAGRVFEQMPRAIAEIVVEALPVPASDPARSLIGRTVGAYSIQSLIAHGGMGAVYLARQERPRRDVAIKLMTAGLWSRTAWRRFELEQDILGRLHHPNIAQVYEAGTHALESGATVPFFAMEYVPAAQSITAFCDAHRLDRSARLGLFCSACAAVHHGHQKGVVHRDLKPGNILIDEQGHVKVIDFGVARLTDSDRAATTLLTEAGQIIGTLAYMSPEQISGAAVTPDGPPDIDTRSDVYSLGAVLYELLTGRLPHDLSGLTLHSAMRIICEREPASPSALAGIDGLRVPPRGDLEAIVLRALEKNRERRYNSAAALAEDIERHLRGEPISARPPTRWALAMRWAARHPYAVSLAISLSIILLASLGTAGSLYYMHLEPDQVEVRPDGRRVILRSRTGHDLHEWPVQALQVKGATYCAEMLERPAELGGGRLAVIAYTVAVADESLRGRLCGYEIDGPTGRDKPYWTAALDDALLPQALRDKGRNTRDCAVHVMCAADVFKDAPGPEIVVAYTLGVASLRAICIYDLAGKLLHAAWHDGSVSSFYWLERAGLLACAAEDEDVKAALERSVTVPQPKGAVVFAWRPQLNRIAAEFIKHVPDRDPLRPAWYRYVWPPSTKAFEHGTFVINPAAADPADAALRLDFRIGLTAADGSAVETSTSVALNEHGEVLPRSRQSGDVYRQYQTQGRLPDAAIFQLHDHPPTARDLWPAEARP